MFSNVSYKKREKIVYIKLYKVKRGRGGGETETKIVCLRSPDGDREGPPKETDIKTASDCGFEPALLWWENGCWHKIYRKVVPLIF